MSQTSVLWEMLQQQGFELLRACEPHSAVEAGYLMFMAFRYGDLALALRLSQQAAMLDPDSLVFPAAQQYLARIAQQGHAAVYDAPAAFAAFIRGGGNLPLYQAVSAALRQHYREFQPASLLEIGVGDGMALLPALDEQTAPTLTLVEPSAALLQTTCASLDARGVTYHAFNQPIQQFISGEQGHWDVAQATFSLQSLPPDERLTVFRWLRKHAHRLLLVEFAIPAELPPEDPAYIASILRRFETGIAEYQADRELVTQGFLMPVLFGYVDRTMQRTNYEQPIDDWIAQLHQAGFTQIRQQTLYDYWWSPAVLLEAAG